MRRRSISTDAGGGGSGGGGHGQAGPWMGAPLTLSVALTAACMLLLALPGPASSAATYSNLPSYSQEFDLQQKVAAFDSDNRLVAGSVATYTPTLNYDSSGPSFKIYFPNDGHDRAYVNGAHDGKTLDTAYTTFDHNPGATNVNRSECSMTTAISYAQVLCVSPFLAFFAHPTAVDGRSVFQSPPGDSCSGYPNTSSQGVWHCATSCNETKTIIFCVDSSQNVLAVLSLLVAPDGSSNLRAYDSKTTPTATTYTADANSVIGCDSYQPGPTCVLQSFNADGSSSSIPTTFPVAVPGSSAFTAPVGSPSPPTSKGSTKSHTGLIVGIIAGVCAIVLIAAVVAVILIRRKKRIPKPDDTDEKRAFELPVHSQHHPREVANAPVDHERLGAFPQLLNNHPVTGYASERPTTLGSVLSAAAGIHGAIASEAGEARPLVSGFTLSPQLLAAATDSFNSSRFLGAGSFGSVYRAVFPDGLQAAVKVVDTRVGGAFAEAELMAEVKALRGMQHPNILTVQAAFEASPMIYLVMELMEGGSLDTYLQVQDASMALSWTQRLSILTGIARGLEFLHTHNPPVVHRDLKPKNVLLDINLAPKIADFGLAKRLEGNESTRLVGTFGYISPEYASSGKATQASDVFGFGVMMMQVLTGRQPFDDKRPSGEQHLLQWVTSQVKGNNVMKLVDPLMLAAVDMEAFTSVVIMAIRCTARALMRPTASEIVRNLQLLVL